MKFYEFKDFLKDSIKTFNWYEVYYDFDNKLIDYNIYNMKKAYCKEFGKDLYSLYNSIMCLIGNTNDKSFTLKTLEVKDYDTFVHNDFKMRLGLIDCNNEEYFIFISTNNKFLHSEIKKDIINKISNYLKIKEADLSDYRVYKEKPINVPKKYNYECSVSSYDLDNCPFDTTFHNSIKNNKIFYIKDYNVFVDYHRDENNKETKYIGKFIYDYFRIYHNFENNIDLKENLFKLNYIEL